MQLFRFCYTGHSHSSAQVLGGQLYISRVFSLAVLRTEASASLVIHKLAQLQHMLRLA